VGYTAVLASKVFAKRRDFQAAKTNHRFQLFANKCAAKDRASRVKKSPIYLATAFSFTLDLYKKISVRKMTSTSSSSSY